MKYLFIYLVIVNAAGYVVMLMDKNNARNGKKRVAESSLFCLAGIGGSVGILAGMLTIRHKTRKLRFLLGIPGIILVQLALLKYFLF